MTLLSRLRLRRYKLLRIIRIEHEAGDWKREWNALECLWECDRDIYMAELNERARKWVPQELKESVNV